MAWLVPENKLDPQQREFLDTMDINKRNVWIKGFPGSGKSVLLLYVARMIKARSESSKVLLIVFTRSLVEMFKSAFRELGLSVPVETYYGFMDDPENKHYDYILCDEVQDLTPRVLQAIKDRGSHVVVAGDTNQSIYEVDPRRKEATVRPEEVEDIISAVPFELSIIHRLSQSVIVAVQSFIPHMNILSAKTDMTKSDTQIRLCKATTQAEEVKYIMQEADKAVSQGYTAAILLSRRSQLIDFANQALGNAGKQTWNIVHNKYNGYDFGSLNAHLSQSGVKLQYVGGGYGSFAQGGRSVTLMNYHSAKGLDFDNVFIPFANASMYICNDRVLAKTLFMVAMTRAREYLYITYSGSPCSYLGAFGANCSHIDIASVNNTPAPDGSGSLWGF